MAATAMQLATFEASCPVSGHQVGSPVPRDARHASAGRDVVLGHQAFFAFRLLLTATVYFVVIAAFGAVSSPLGVLAIPVTVLVGALLLRRDRGVGGAHADRGLVRRDLPLPDPPDVPLLGDVLPDLDAPAPLEFIAWLTPLWHGVTLCRDLMLGDISLGDDLMHLGYLLACVTVGLLLAGLTYRSSSS